MRLPSLSRSLRSSISAVAAVVATSLLVFMIVFTEFDVHWVTFLAGVLMAATFSLPARAAKADGAAVSEIPQASELQENGVQEGKRRQQAEGLLPGGKARIHVIGRQ